MVRAQRTKLERFFISLNHRLRGRTDAYLARRPHRSFRRTRRRDYVRSFELPGYVALTRQTFAMLLSNKQLFGAFFVIYTLASALALGVISQTNYSALTDALKDANPDLGLRVFAIFSAAVTGGLNPTSSGNSGLLSLLLIVFGWLIMIWLLRNVAANKRVRLRDGLYNAGAPLIPTLMLALVGLLQSLPIIVATIGFSAARNTGLLENGIEAMLFFAVAVLLSLLSLYWLTSTFVSLVVVTLPGMYPFTALKAAGDLAVGRRLRLILRLLWVMIVVLVVWIIVLVPAILVDNAVSLSWLPIVPICVLLLSTATLVLISTYIYLLYRNLVDDKAKPA